MAMFEELYKCNFCRIDFIRLPLSKLRLADKVLALIGLPLHQCPHCFSCCNRPALPFGSQKAAVKAPLTATEISQLESDTDGDCGPVIMSMNPELASSAK